MSESLSTKPEAHCERDQKKLYSLLYFYTCVLYLELVNQGLHSRPKQRAILEHLGNYMFLSNFRYSDIAIFSTVSISAIINVMSTDYIFKQFPCFQIISHISETGIEYIYEVAVEYSWATNVLINCNSATTSQNLGMLYSPFWMKGQQRANDQLEIPKLKPKCIPSL